MQVTARRRNTCQRVHTACATQRDHQQIYREGNEAFLGGLQGKHVGAGDAISEIVDARLHGSRTAEHVIQVSSISLPCSECRTVHQCVSAYKVLVFLHGTIKITRWGSSPQPF